MTETIKLTPVMGMDTETDATQLVTGDDDAPAVFVRDALNVDINAQGKTSLRRGLRKISEARLLDLLHDTLHGDTFGRDAEHYLVRVNLEDGSVQRLAEAGDAPLGMVVQARQVIFSTARGLLAFDGVQAAPFTIPTPPAPMVRAEENGALDAGQYRVALAWLRGETESACSQTDCVAVRTGGRLRVSLPLCMDASVERVRVFLSDADGGRLQTQGTYPVATTEIEIASAARLAGAPRFLHMEPMRAGRYLCAWQGRLLTAQTNVLHFSEPMAQHIHDPRHGFIQMPQRITFLAPVDGGVWVGQTDHVAFLAGNDMREVSVRRLHCAPPVPDSCVLVGAPVVRETGGRPAAVWLAANGHVVGMPDGTLIEPRAGRLAGISGAHGSTAVLNSRVLTCVT